DAVDVQPARVRVGRMPFRVGDDAALAVRVADVSPVVAVVDLRVAVLVEYHGVAPAGTRLETEYGVLVVVEAAMGKGIGDHGRVREPDHCRECQGHVVGDADMDLVAVAATRRPDRHRHRDIGRGL